MGERFGGMCVHGAAPRMCDRCDWGWPTSVDRMVAEAQRPPDTVEFRGQRWLVVDARWDEAEGGGHWHLTLTNPGQNGGQTP